MNKKRLSFILSTFAIALLAALNMNLHTNEYGSTDVSLDNVEALAQESSIPSCQPVKGGCHKNGITTDHSAFK